ncbi:DUF4381 domain-containing protein [Coralloluteibacterium stylophorae]|uniref:DUF4381 domain-containing protein n=1 Tax=Coralloluteibacterium stylophorae TaxID=1776034 RepID=A0A8J7VTN7_9GAMM|nr:DUF4381 domain-containing protein [Coralloluteibacterium stylophorae]MBS7458389.1 DUF4381 domain-containing protein [Coralloluteibacterium stylophorae]
MTPAAAQGPQLRDIHLPPPPEWWPPAWGWWVVAALALSVLAVLFVLVRRTAARRRRQRRLRAEFDAVQAADVAPAERLRRMSELLRRAARRAHPEAAVLGGEAWLQFLDANEASRPFSAGPGRILDSGPYRRGIDATEVELALPLVRRRFLDLLEDP